MTLLFGWECFPDWYKFARVVELFVMDAFIDLFITLCIVINTLFMAMDHAGMSDQMTRTLTVGNYVSTAAIGSNQSPLRFSPFWTRMSSEHN